MLIIYKSTKCCFLVVNILFISQAMTFDNIVLICCIYALKTRCMYLQFRVLIYNEVQIFALKVWAAHGWKKERGLYENKFLYEWRNFQFSKINPANMSNYFSWIPNQPVYILVTLNPTHTISTLSPVYRIW